jgi:hypothetical protein
MTAEQFTAFNDLLKAYYAFAVATQGRQHDHEHMDKQRLELVRRVDEARKVLVQPSFDTTQHA